MYSKFINYLRITVALLATLSGAGLIYSLHYRPGPFGKWSALGFVLGFLITLGLAFEYLIRMWIQSRKGHASRRQFTIRRMLAVTALCAFVLTPVHYLGAPTLITIFLGLGCAGTVVVVAVASILDHKHHAKHKKSNLPRD